MTLNHSPLRPRQQRNKYISWILWKHFGDIWTLSYQNIVLIEHQVVSAVCSVSDHKNWLYLYLSTCLFCTLELFFCLHLSFILCCTRTAHNAHVLPIQPLFIFFWCLRSITMYCCCFWCWYYWLLMLDTLLLTSLLCPQIENIIGKCLSTPIIETLAQKLINKLCIVIILSRDG